VTFFLYPFNSWTNIVLVFCIVGACSTGLTVLTPNGRLLATTQISLILPAIAAGLFVGSEHALTMSALSAVYLGFLLFHGRGLSQKYHESLQAQLDLKVALEAKNQFLANMSHEMRTPLHGVIGLSRVLEAMEIPAEALETVRMIRSSGDALLRVINDVLDFSKMEAGKMELEISPFSLPHALEDSVSLFRAAAAEKGLRLVCNLDPELPLWVAGDEKRLRQIVLNLVSNAVKFTTSGEVALSASLEHQDEQGGKMSLAIEVRDTGVGIAPDQLPVLFESFSQADSSISRRYGGTGLGLAISKQLAELMGGRIEVDSKAGEGTRFRFTFQIGHATQPPPQASPSPSPVPGAHLVRVLVAEDNVVNQKVVLKLLKQLGVSADLVADGSQAVASAMARAYDLVLMDVQMPQVDGLTATREIRSGLRGDQQPIIYGLTAHATTEYRDFCLRAGMDGYLTKPLDLERLRDLIQRLAARWGPDLG
jgi:signal transduction histidine kinase